MTTDENDLEWLTLTEAAARTGYSREALRLRVRRKKLRAEKGRNDKQVRVNVQDLNDLPPVSEQDDQDVDPVIKELLEDLRTSRTDLDKLQQDRLVDRGRAERAEAQAAGIAKQLEMETTRTAQVEARLATVEAALAEARLPWLARVVRAIRG